MAVDLYDYQEACIEAVRRGRADEITRQLLVLATGLGKTVIAGALIQKHEKSRVLFLVHRDELVRQAIERFSEWIPTDRIGVEKAREEADPRRHRVVVGSIQTLRNIRRLAKFDADWPGMIFVDETHHAAARSYLKILDHFNLYGDDPDRKKLLLGLTATPNRADQKGFDKIFDDVVFRYGLTEGIRDGWLADMRAYRIRTNLDLSGVKVSRGDYNQKELAGAVNTPERNALVAQSWAKHCPRGSRSIFFCVDKQHAADVREALAAAGARVAVIVDDTPMQQRRAALRLFREGELDGLVNCMVLTEGFDEPLVTAIHMLRPTKSQPLFVQAIGRGTRKAPGKTHVDVFDYTDQGHNPCSIGEIFGLPDAWDLAGEPIVQAQQEIQEIEADLGVRLKTVQSLEDLRRRMSVRSERFELIKGALTDWSLPGKFIWLEASGGRYVLAWRNETQRKLFRRDGPERGELEELLTRWNLWGVRERLEIFQNELGNWECVLIQDRRGTRERVRLSQEKSQTRLVRAAESWLQEQRPHKVGLLKKAARWATEPASEKQLEILRRKGVPRTLVESGLTKREASVILEIPNARIRALFCEEEPEPW